MDTFLVEKSKEKEVRSERWSRGELLAACLVVISVLNLAIMGVFLFKVQNLPQQLENEPNFQDATSHLKLLSENTYKFVEMFSNEESILGFINKGFAAFASSNSSMADMAVDLLHQDFAGLGSDAEQFGKEFFNAINGDYGTTDSRYGLFDVAFYAGWTQSIAHVIAQTTPLSGAPKRTVVSDIFQNLRDFVKYTSSAGDWSTFGAECLQYIGSLYMVDWSGSFTITDTYGQPMKEQWDWNTDMSNGLLNVKAWCSMMKDLQPSQSESTKSAEL